MLNKSHLTRRNALKATALAALGLPLAIGSLAAADSPSGKKNRAPTFKLGVASYSFNTFPVDKVIPALKQLDIHYASLFKTHAPWDGTAETCREAAQKFKDAGIAVTGTGVVNLPNEEAAVRKAFENVKAAGLPAMMCKPSLDAFPLVEKFVKEFDIRLAIHNHGPEDNVYSSPYKAWDAVQPYDKRIGLCIDVGHAARGGVDPVEAIKKCRERLYDIHLKDSIAEVGAMHDVPVEIGRGKLDIRAMLTALIEIEYPHIVAIEFEKRGENYDVVAGLAESIGYVRGVLAEMAG